MKLMPINPAVLGAPRGYSNGMLAPAGARLLTVAGQIAWDADQNVVSNEFPAQLAQALANVVTVVREAGGEPSHILELTLFVVDRHEYLAATKEIGAAYRQIMGRHFPTMALIEISALLDPRAKVEIQALAALPPDVLPPQGAVAGETNDDD